MSRANLKRYQNTYAEAMQKYGLQRGIEGSEAQHISTHEYYRSLMAQGKDIQEDVEALLKQKEQAICTPTGTVYTYPQHLPLQCLRQPIRLW